MEEEELLKKMEKVDLSGIESESHRYQLRVELLQSYGKKSGSRFPGLAVLKMIIPLIIRRPAWQKALASVLVIVIVLGTGSIYLMGQDSSWEALVKKASAANAEITSFHCQSSTVSTLWYEGENLYEATTNKTEAEGLLPDRSHSISWYGEEMQKGGEQWTIGDKTYHWGLVTGWEMEQKTEEVAGQQTGKTYKWDYQKSDWEETSGSFSSSNPLNWLEEHSQPLDITESLKKLEDVEKLPDEVIDGINCLHYKGKWDPIEYMREQIEEETDLNTRESQQEIIELFEQIGLTESAEIWIGKEDYLVRQQCLQWTFNATYNELRKWFGGYLSVPENTILTVIETMTERYYDFNEPVEIEVPSPEAELGESAWSIMTVDTKHLLLSVWGSSSSNVFAVGTGGIILHYNGSIWSEMTSNTTGILSSIWGSSSSDVFAVGRDGTILRYDGVTWSPMDSNTTGDLNGIWGSSSSDVYAVGKDGTILHYDGVTWSSMNSNTTGDLNGIWGSSSSDVYAVGKDGTILQYDGSIWSEMNSRTTSRLKSIWGSSPSNIIAISSFEMLQYDGSAWSAGSLSRTLGWLPSGSVWGNSSFDIFVVGDDGIILHYDGVTWSRMISSTAGDLYSIWGSSSSDVFVVGYDSDNLNSIILHYGG